MTEIDLGAFKAADPSLPPLEPISFGKGEGGFVPVDDILMKLNRRPFSTWPVSQIMACPQPKVYRGARMIFALRTVPYFKELFGAMEDYDIDIDYDRVDFVIETLDMEMPQLFVDMLGTENKAVDVLLSYCAGAKNMRRLMTEHSSTSHDFALGLALSMRLGFDVLSMMGFKTRKREAGSKHPLAHPVVKA